MSDEQPPLSPSESELAAIASRQTPDGFLNQLVLLAERGAGIGLGLLLNGMVVTGQLVPPERIAAEIDAERRMIVSRSPRPDDLTDDEWSKQTERFATTAMRAVDAWREDLEQLNVEADAHAGPDGLDPETAPAELARRAIGANARSHLTLADARLFAPGHRGVTCLPVMRIAIRQLAGWWILRTDALGDSKLVLWPQDDPNAN
jgi:hypothetical protein